MLIMQPAKDIVRPIHLSNPSSILASELVEQWPGVSFEWMVV